MFNNWSTLSGYSSISESVFKNKASVSLLCEQEKSSNDKLSNADVIFILVIACLFCRRQRYNNYL